MPNTIQTATRAEAAKDKQAGQITIAPAWHTFLMILLVMGPLIQATAVERSNPGAALPSPAAVPLYLIGAVVQCIFFAFAWWGVRLRKNSIHTLIGERWASWKELARDMGTALLFWVFWYAALSVLKLVLVAEGISNARTFGMVYPKGALEVALWIPNAILA